MSQRRAAITSRTETVPVTEIHSGDLLVATDGDSDLYVHAVKRSGSVVSVTVWRDGERVWDLPTERLVTVRTEFPCDCGGSGVYRWGGTENGKTAKEGPHYACAEKGWQSRSDVIRNSTYWNKYARISF